MAENKTSSNVDKTYSSGSFTSAETQKLAETKLVSKKRKKEGESDYLNGLSTQAQSQKMLEPELDEAKRIEQEGSIYGTGKPRRILLRARIKPHAS